MHTCSSLVPSTQCYYVGEDLKVSGRLKQCPKDALLENQRNAVRSRLQHSNGRMPSPVKSSYVHLSRNSEYEICRGYSGNSQNICQDTGNACTDNYPQ